VRLGVALSVVAQVNTMISLQPARPSESAAGQKACNPAQIAAKVLQRI
jgi:hypothetical protein